MSLLDQRSNISCPKCKRELGLTLRDIKPSLITCRFCRAKIKLTGDNVSKEIENFENELKRIGGNRTFRFK